MSEKLLESDFLTIDLASIVNKKESTATIARATIRKSNKRTKIDWSKELHKRIYDNSKLPDDSRKTEYEVEKIFWTEYFYANWEKPIAEKLMQIGNLLREDIENFGFEKTANPLLAFITLPYVQKNLILPGLLSSVTYKALHTAWSEDLIADSELIKANNYNIIYCRDLYRKSPAEIKTYLKLQNNSYLLSVNKTVYNLTTQQRNRCVFLAFKKNTTTNYQEKLKYQLKIPTEELASVRTPGIKLNDLNFVEDLLLVISKKGQSIENKLETAYTNYNDTLEPTTDNELINYANKFDTVAKIYAMLQFICMNTSSNKAITALVDKRFSKISQQELSTAISQISKYTSKTKLPVDRLDDLVGLLVKKL